MAGTAHTEEQLARVAHPSIPIQSWDRGNVNIYSLRTWKQGFTVSTLAGLLTEARFHANGIRLDWLQRLAFAKAGGQRRPKHAELSRALNRGLEEARVLRLEDPVEDLFCQRIVSTRGDFRIFTDQWATPGPFTQTLLEAFEELPAAPQKEAALASVYAILRVSNELAQRANVDPFTPSAGVAGGIIDVPDHDELRQLAARVRFTTKDLLTIGVPRQALSPFVLEPFQLRYIATSEPGDSPLELHPLLGDATGVTVASPSGISLAVRAVLISTAKRGGLAQPLLAHLLRKQERYAGETGFWPTHTMSLSAPDQNFLRSTTLGSPSGKHLQVIQVPVPFDDFPARGFAGVRRFTTDTDRAIASKISGFWNDIKQQTQIRESTTVLLLSGWGTPHSTQPSIEYEKAPSGWRFIAVSFADVATLGACKDGGYYSIRRMVEQVKRLEDDGFSFTYANGLLNLFGCWRSTDGNLIPEHMHEIVPPCDLLLPTDELLAPRIEAAKKCDPRALPFIDGTYKAVLLGDVEDQTPVYTSLSDLRKQRMVGATSIEGRIWWIETLDESDAPWQWRYHTWQSILQWLIAVGPAAIRQFPIAFPGGARMASVRVPSLRVPQVIGTKADFAVDLVSSVTVLRDYDPPTIVVHPDWLKHVHKAENDAEVELVAAVLEALQTVDKELTRRDELRDVVRSAIASSAWRWLHAKEAFTITERLATGGLLAEFRGLPLSAVALAKCRLIWQFRDRSDGTEIVGEEDCRSFLVQYQRHILDLLVSRIRHYERDKLVVFAATNYQSARHEHSRWSTAMRALRAIQGAGADESAFTRQSEINAVQRAAKCVMEVAACEAGMDAALAPDQQDLEDLFALALMLFHNGHLFASVRAGLVKPLLRISPAGDVLSDRSAVEKAFMPTVRLATKKRWDEADASYGRDAIAQGVATDERLPIDDAFRRAIEAEYKEAAEAFVDLPYAILLLAEARGAGVFLLKRSELVNELQAIEAYRSKDAAGMLKRLTLPARNGWHELADGMTEGDKDLSRFDRRYSLMGRPFLALEAVDDPLLLVSPILISEAIHHALAGMKDGTLQNHFWISTEAKRFVGARADARGHAFEERVAERLRNMGLKAWPSVTPAWVVNDKAPSELGNIDVLAVSADNKRLWVIEAKDLQFCRTEGEVAARLSAYRGRMKINRKGMQEPDDMLRHLRRVQYLRGRSDAVCRQRQLKLSHAPEVRGLLIVDSPQPMNFYMLDSLEDGQSAFLEAIEDFNF